MLASLVLVITAARCLELLDQPLQMLGAAMSPASVDGTAATSMESWASASAAEELTSLINRLRASMTSARRIARSTHDGLS